MNKDNNINLFIKWLNEINENDLLLVGGKAVNIGRLIKENINCPSGFCITTEAFDFYLKNSGFQNKILAILRDKSKQNESAALEIKNFLRKVKIPGEIQETITKAYWELQKQEEAPPLAVRSSATVEDLKDASFAGQFDSFLGIIGGQNLIKAVKKCWDSLFNAHSLAYARRKHLKTSELKMGVIVQRLIMAKAAGVMFTIHPVTLEKNHFLIESTFGLANQLVSGKISPDIIVLSKNTLKTVKQITAEKKVASEFDSKKKRLTIKMINPSLRNETSLNSKEMKKLGRLGKRIENLFNCPQDIEWAIEKEKIFIVQARPMTTT